MDEVVLDGKTYIASKAAASMCGYTQDYVGQLCRGGHIDARRVSGHWYINVDSLKAYKAKAETFKPEPPKFTPDPNAEASIFIEDKEYLSASRAAKLTSYAQDYIGQLARANKVPSRQIGGRWYVEKDALLSHKSEKDALLAAVQAQSVGLKKYDTVAESAAYIPQLSISAPVAIYKAPEPLLSYSSDDRDLLPIVKDVSDESETASAPIKNVVTHIETSAPVEKVMVPIHIIRQVKSSAAPPDRRAMHDSQLPAQRRETATVAMPGKSIFRAKILVPVFVAVLAISVGTIGYMSSIQATGGISMSEVSLTASAASSVQYLGDFIESLFGAELVYLRN